MYSQNKKYGFTRVQNQCYDLFRNKMYADVTIRVEMSTNRRRKFLLTSHAYLVQGMKSSLELILGEQECVDVVCAYTDGQYDIKVEIEKKLTALQPEDELIVIADLWHIDVRHYKLAL